ncbi:hypothetical protein, variant 3 [Aphanomyces astaci]|uniref:DNA mismatch repair proteins mutS family domain-containing protein n=3 Tax=Aphanomyces astaci TaxID=112090 RepID=W4GRF2_APHAT|nr:hypothetical protein, variant 3 [Aphanomyces astaci]ETV82305.1 hypothetical protein, variant 3 [Aphanomyces astaci]|eukprot:XP_009827974.1 hypothetical protein, variant 3 [Aphanomyces astaci]
MSRSTRTVQTEEDASLRTRINMDEDVSTRKTKTPRVATASRPARRTFIAVVAEGKCREVGITGIDISAPHELLISNMVDTHTFMETISLLDAYQPDEILLVETNKARSLHQEIRKHFKNSMCRIVPIARKYFDQAKGADDLKRIAMNCLDMSLLKNYIVMGSVACMVKYVEFIQGVYIAQKTIKAVVNTASPVLLMDYNTVSSLELMRGAKSGSTQQSLVSRIDYTQTSVGKRLLRTTILRPNSDLETINGRQQVVGTLLDHPSTFFDAREILPELPDLEILMAQLVIVPKLATTRVFEQGVASIVALKSTLDALPRLKTCLQSIDSNSTLLKAIVSSLQHEEFRQIQDSIRKVIDPNSHWKKSARHMKIQGSFAVKSGLDGKLDLTRSTFVDIMDAIHQQVVEYQEKYAFNVKLNHSASRGYHLSIANLRQDIPPMFEECVKFNKSIACTTKQFSSLNSRATECIQEVYALSYGMIQKLLDEIRPHAASLYSMVENIATLDMLLSFANLVALSPADQPYTCPEVTEHGCLSINQGRHSLIETMMQDQPFVPNDTHLDVVVTFNVVTGPNCSGKSTHLKTVAVITVLAHIGCYVPAVEASIALRDRLFTRFGTSDDMQENASTFTVEMQETAFILDNCTCRSLVLMDELGRGTSNEEGFAIAWSVSESLMKKGAFCLFATHFHGLRELSELYPSCSNYHLQATTTDKNILRFQYKLKDGPTELRHGYGLMMAKVCGLPKSVCELASSLHPTVALREENLVVKTVDDTSDLQNMLLKRLMALRYSNLDDNGESYLCLA